MARSKPKTAIGGGENFNTPAKAMMNGAQPWTQRGVKIAPGVLSDADEDESDENSDYLAGADDAQQSSLASGKVASDRDFIPLTDEELGAIVQQQLTDAVTFIDYEVGPMRAQATEAYRGRMDYADADGDTGDAGYEDQALAPAGRTQIASRDVRDTITGMMPDLMRMFTSSDDVVQFEPTTAKDVPLAAQATDYANYVFTKDNPGFEILHDTIKDALTQKTGIVKVWFDDAEIVRTESYTGLDPVALQVLEDDTDVESIEVIKEYEFTPHTIGIPLPVIDAKVKRRMKKGRIRIESLPPEEFLVDRRARSLECDTPSSRGFNLVAHRSMMTTSELVALGYSESLIREHITNNELDFNVERVARQPWARTVGGFEGINPVLQRVLYVESYVWVDSDGDGIAELHQVCTMGPSYKIVSREPVDFIPFAVFHCDKEPHTFFGQSITDVTADIQRIKTQVWRDSLDSLAQSVRPRMAVVEGQVNYEDLLNDELGGVIRMRAPGMAQALTTPFVGQDAFGMIEYTDSVLDKRTGVSMQSMGLSADTMQSTTALAVQQQVSASQGRIELIARMLSDGLRQVFKLILNLSCAHQDKPRTVQLRGQWVEVDPRYWNADMAVQINIGLGTGTAKDKIAGLTQILAQQEKVLTNMGPNNPLCSLSQYSTTLAKIVELAGFKNTGMFFNQIPAGQQPPQPPAPPPPPPNPELIKVQNDSQIAQQKMQLEAQRLQLDQMKAAQEDQRLREKDAAQIQLQARELELKYQTQVQSQAANALIDDVQHQREQDNAMTQAAMDHVANAHQAIYDAANAQALAAQQQQAQPAQPGQYGEFQ
ncbi:hypothetical protein [Paraburkholderia terrae]|uniref:portal protein n=1 Tax=Paraburkholderia terrae TaxID=311230 RepID=UPI002059A9C0|nr:hypothetical protein [Paraburkholderia terrae]BDC37911.1 hypothetical protein PTKU15_12080 [Paraburkholderia terrae]